MIRSIRISSVALVSMIAIMALATACADPAAQSAGTTNSAGQSSVRSVEPSSPGSSQISNAVLPPATDLGRLVQPMTYPAFSLALNPPPASSVPEIAASAVYATCGVSMMCPPVSSGGPTILLAMATSGNRSADPGGVQIPDIKGSLAYLLRWTNVPCDGGGPAGSTDSAAPSTCLWLIVVDATTGELLGDLETNSTSS
jgi:hypothetical protein